VTGLDGDERAKVEHERECLRLAAWDMEQTNTAAICIPHPNYENVRAVMQTGLAVGYARPFTRSDAEPRLNLLRLRADGRQQGTDWLPEDAHDRLIHRQLMNLRNKVYAHADKTDWRTVVSEGVQWSWMSREFLVDVAAMTERQRDRFRAAALERKRRLDEPPA
jgi:hypothetical protein